MQENKTKIPHLHCEISERRIWLGRVEGHIPLCFPGTRESAFAYALAAAAVPHSIARACASGELPLCSCGPGPSELPGPGFRWGGCGDNLRYGLQLGAAFADSPSKSSKLGTQALRAMNLHNNAVGRQVGMGDRWMWDRWGRCPPQVLQPSTASSSPGGRGSLCKTLGRLCGCCP